MLAQLCVAFAQPRCLLWQRDTTDPQPDARLWQAAAQLRALTSPGSPPITPKNGVTPHRHNGVIVEGLHRVVAAYRNQCQPLATDQHADEYNPE